MAGNDDDNNTPPSTVFGAEADDMRYAAASATTLSTTSECPSVQYFATGDDRVRSKQARNGARSTRSEDPTKTKSMAQKAGNAKSTAQKGNRFPNEPRHSMSIWINVEEKLRGEDQERSDHTRTSVQSSFRLPKDRGDENVAALQEGPKDKPGETKTSEDGLAIAVPIDEENEDEKYIPAAVKFDPDSKPPIFRNRRFKLYGGLGCCTLIIVIIVSIVASLNKSSEESKIVFLTLAPTPAPSPAPTSARDTLYRSIFADQVGPQVYERGTAHEMAAHWIIHEDPMRLEVDSDNLVQRFVLAFVYFHFSSLGTNPWRSCNPPADNETETCDYAVISRNQTGHFVFTDVPGRTRWLSDTPECDWIGVVCAGSPNVVSLEIVGQKLSGSLPLEIGSLSFLQRLSLYYNDITGTIPGEYSELKHLITLELLYNQINGTIPEEFYTRGGNPLMTLNVGGNLLTGTISTQVGLLTDLKGFHVFDNMLSGSIPSEMGNMRFLAYARLGNNTLTGTIPTEAASLRNLTEWLMDHNKLSGSVPTEIGTMNSLTDLRLNHNMLTGTIPEEIYDVDTLKLMIFNKNRITGTISTRIGLLTNLIQYRAAFNPIGGTIPSEMGDMESLGLAWLHIMNLTGEMPFEVCDNRGPGRLERLQTDCFPFDDPPVPCRCCTACCDRQTKICLTNNN